MSHGIEQSKDGRATFAAYKEGGWHLLGTVSEEPLTIQSALELAFLANREYQTVPIMAMAPDGSYVATDRHQAVIRKHPFTDEWQVLGAGMSPGYRVHTPEETFAFGEAILDMGYTLSAIGSIDDGRKAFAAFALDEIMVGGVDKVSMWLNMLTAFDWSMSTTARASGTRVVCKNTFNSVVGETEAPTFRARHSGDPLSTKVDDARAALGLGWKGLQQFQEEAERMIQQAVTDSVFEQIVEDFFPVKEDAKPFVQDRARTARAKVLSLYDGPTVANIRGTAWGSLNAITEYLDWSSPGRFKTPEQRMVAQITPGTTIDRQRTRAGLMVARRTGLAKV